MRTPGFYSLVLEDPEAVAQAWMPFLMPGGLWVRGRRQHVLGEEVVLLVQLPGGGRHSVAGTVAWIDPESLPDRNHRKTGIALDGSDGAELAEHIRKLTEAGPSPAESFLSCC